MDAEKLLAMRLDRQYLAGLEQGYLLGSVAGHQDYMAVFEARMRDIVEAKKEESKS